MSSLVGGIIERKSSASVPKAPSLLASSQHGFPVAKHRSQSAFARGRQQANQRRSQDVPFVHTAPAKPITPAASTSRDAPMTDDWRAGMAQQNDATVQSMTDEERQRAVNDIFDTLGDGVGDLLRRARAARERKGAVASHATPLEISTVPAVSSAGPSSPRAGATPLTSRPVTPTRSAMRTPLSRRNSNHVNFIDIKPHDVHVYESEPSSPRRVLGLIAPRTEEDGEVPVHVLKTLGLASSQEPMPVDPPADDDPESIRAKFFPDEPIDNPSLEWTKTPKNGEVDAAVRFDLQGQPIPPELADSLPSHLGLHHHAQGARAGYTLNDLLLLSRSSVPAQRASMLSVLSHVLRKLHRGELQQYDLGATRGHIRENVLQTGAASLAESGSVCVRAVDVLWEGLVAWDHDALAVEGVWINGEGYPDPLSKLLLPTLLINVKRHFAQAALPTETLTQLLQILHRLSRDSPSVCDAIMSTDGLLNAVTRLFLPVVPSDDNVLAIVVLRQLAASSREQASALIEVAETLLRYIVTFNATTPLPRIQFVTETLRLYACLARYGLFANVAGLAAVQLAQLLQTIRQRLNTPTPELVALMAAFLEATEAWTVCAIDPHRTTPEHDFLWSQVVGLEWGRELLQLREVFVAANVGSELHARLWSALAALLNGAKVNSSHGGEAEKVEVNAVFAQAFTTGVERSIFRTALAGLQERLHELEHSDPQPDFTAVLRSVRGHAIVLSSAVRMAVAVARPDATDQLVQLFASDGDVVSLLFSVPLHRLWNDDRLTVRPYVYSLVRPLSNLLHALHALVTLADAAPSVERIAAASTLLSILPSGDGERAAATLRTILASVTPELLASVDYSNPSTTEALGAVRHLEPFLVHELCRGQKDFVAPLTTSPESLQQCTTQVLPNKPRRSPASPDWPLWPLNSLLKSGSSPVFAQLPNDWNATETDLTRAALLLAHVVQRSIARSRLKDYLPLRMSRDEAIFGCMRVFMLEHGQEAGSGEQEVFRDAVVDALMRDLLRPFTLDQRIPSARPAPQSPNLEAVAARYLGPDTPFFQFYSDFVALYDSVSFAHPLFGALLIPPLATQYSSDYRRVLLADHASTLAHLRVAVPNVLAADAMDFMHPLEMHPEVLGGMLGALVKGLAHDFVRAICMHHAASHIWADLGQGNEARAVAMLGAIVRQGDLETVREVVRYGGCTSAGPIPITAEARAARWAWVQQLEDKTLAERLHRLLAQ